MKITVSQLRKIIQEEVQRVNEAGKIPAWKLEPFQHPTKPPMAPKCAQCGKKLTQLDKDAYEAEGGEGFPEVCQDCAEMP